MKKKVYKPKEEDIKKLEIYLNKIKCQTKK